MVSPAARLIGGTFLERGLISHDQLETALEAQHLTGQLLGEILVAYGWITRMELADALAEHWRARDAAAAAVGDNVFDLDEWREQVERANAEVSPVVGDRGAEAGSEPVPAPSFLALAATTGRYLLIECDGPLPGVGDRIALSDLDGSFRVVRHGCSPLPLDNRSCVYVERVPEPVDPLTS